MNRYDYDINLDDDSVAARIVRLVGYDKHVLELGCSGGHMSRVFQQRGCTVVGVEYDAAVLEGARPYCAAVYPLDLNDPAWTDAVKAHGPFDAIVAADVLEHLRDPRACLARMRTLLAPNGTVVISTPNIAHGGVIAGLLRGEFNYRETGLLDRTHIHFFTEQSLRDTLEAEGFTLIHASPVNADQYHPEFSAQWAKLPPAWQKVLHETPSAKAFQLVMAAVYPAGDEPLVAIRQETQRQLDESRRERDALSQRLSLSQAEVSDARAALEASLHENARLVSEVASAVQQRKQQEHASELLQQRYEELGETLARQAATLEAMRSSTSWQITAPLRVAGRMAKGAVHVLRLSYMLPKRLAAMMYRSLPASWRFEIKETLFNELPWLFRRTSQYHAWQVQQAGSLGIAAHRPLIHATAPGKPLQSQFEPLIYSEPNISCSMRLVAFYLPQFHPIPENDAWWGKGFTEWTNVSKAQPQFEGHYQPHLPGELGFYDLRVPEVMARQVELAKLAGLSGFCFHYYWFAGRRLLERPLDMFLERTELDFPFCICWANETWSRRWDGSESDVLMQQVHTPETDEAFIRDVTQLLIDPRYIRVDGKPVLIIYRVTLLPNACETAERWRSYFKEQGHGELYLVAAQSFDVEDPRDYGFDAAVEFPPHRFQSESIADQMKLYNANYSGRVYDYRELADEFSNCWPQDYVLHKTVSPSWDNEARKPGKGFSFVHSSPEAYASWLQRVLKGTAERYRTDQQLVFVNAWNEWAEGAHLEPDRHHGYAWINRTRESLAPYARVEENDQALGLAQKRAAAAAIIHLYYPELFQEVAAYLLPVVEQLDLFFSVRPGTLAICRDMIQKVFPNAIVVSYPNHGRDVVPFLRIYGHIRHWGYEAILKLHSKKSTHRSDGDRWRSEIYDALIGSPQVIDRHIRRLSVNASSRVGMIGAAGHVLNGKTYWALNKERATELALRFNCPMHWMEDFNFVAGTMYWFHPDALEPLMSLALTPDQFEEEKGQFDGTLAHVVERLMGLSCRKAGLILEDTDGTTHGNSAYDFAAQQPA